MSAKAQSPLRLRHLPMQREGFAQRKDGNVQSCRQPRMGITHPEKISADEVSQRFDHRWHNHPRQFPQFALQ